MISIVVPVLNEAPQLAGLGAHLAVLEGDFEVIFADGGSRDGTLGMASQWGRVVDATAGRASQMNAGAAGARGSVILFLHCDTRLPAEALQKIASALKDENIVGGAFVHQFDRRDWFARFISLSANIRAKLFHLFFGDQAIFIRREVFERVGGYADMPLFEDWELSDRMRRAGQVVLLEDPITTSARRIEVWGKWKCFVIWWGLSILYTLGVSAERLSRFYQHVR